MPRVSRTLAPDRLPEPAASRWAAGEPEGKGKRRLRKDLVTFVLSPPVSKK